MRNKVYISIVSHNQEGLVIENFKNFSKHSGAYDIQLAIVDNTGSEALKSFCDANDHIYFNDGKRRGFGANHNKMFSETNPRNNDIFIVCNPDIIIKTNQLDGIIESFVTSTSDIFSVKIFFDKSINYVDNPDKYFPGFFNFAYSLATDTRLHYGSNWDVKYPQWVSGAFIVFAPEAYRKLNGFDEDYFMYCEDIDLCFRALKLGLTIEHNNNYFIEHDTQMESRSLFSESMLWHVKSAVKFIVKNKFYYPLVIVK